MNNSHLNAHISNQFNEDLEKLRSHLLEMGGIVEDQVKNSVASLETANSALADKVLMVEKTVDQCELDIDQECVLILARRQPAASDLRLVMSVSKATRDLERMGDEAKKIAKMAIRLTREGPSPKGYTELTSIAKRVIKQVQLSLDAFSRFDAHCAFSVIKGDKAIDSEYKRALKDLIHYMVEDPRHISRLVNIMWALRALERIGDHAGNIAQHVIYLVHGTDVRHTPTHTLETLLNNKEEQ